MSLSYFEVKSFKGESTTFASDPLGNAINSATNQANNYLESLGEEVKQVTSTTTQALFYGDYAGYIITMVLEIAIEEDEEAN